MTMKIVPILKVRNMEEAVAFYTRVLDFELKYPHEPLNEWGVDLKNGNSEMMLTASDGIFGVAVNVYVAEVDALFAKYIERGLDVSTKKESPVHQQPLNQTWGTREFYVTDASGNTLRFIAPGD
jgi:uncharacterized glyoxalase superfamily protein PhnB